MKLYQPAAVADKTVRRQLRIAYRRCVGDVYNVSLGTEAYDTYVAEQEVSVLITNADGTPDTKPPTLGMAECWRDISIAPNAVVYFDARWRMLSETTVVLP